MGGDVMNDIIRSGQNPCANCSRSMGSRLLRIKSPLSARYLFGLIVILISLLSATGRAQTSGDIDASLFSLPTKTLSPTPFSPCGHTADECSPNPLAVIQNELNETDVSGGGGSGSGSQDDWVHSWMRKVDEARASQPHYVSPMVTTHVLLVEQFRYDMSWQ